jgi:hypothetical protein
VQNIEIRGKNHDSIINAVKALDRSRASYRAKNPINARIKKNSTQRFRKDRLEINANEPSYS